MMMLLPLALLASLLPFDIAIPHRSSRQGPAPAPPLRLEAHLVGKRVSAQIVNDGPPVRLLLGYTCSGPEPFRLLVDGVEQHFTPATACDKNVERVVSLEHGARTEPVLSSELELGKRTVYVFYRGSGGGHFCAGCFDGELRAPVPLVP